MADRRQDQEHEDHAEKGVRERRHFADVPAVAQLLAELMCRSELPGHRPILVKGEVFEPLTAAVFCLRVVHIAHGVISRILGHL